MEKQKSEPIKTVLSITIGFLILFIVTNWKGLIYLSLFIGIISILSENLSKIIDFYWKKLTWILNTIVQNILLTLIFFFFLFPIAILSRLFRRKDPLNIKNNSNSLFKIENKKFNKDSFEKLW